MALNRLDQMRSLSKGPASQTGSLVYVIIEPSRGECLGVFDCLDKAEQVIDALSDFRSEFYCPDAFIEALHLNRDLLGILDK